MATVKTAFSMPAELFERLEALVRESKLSRSRVITEALENYVRQWDTCRMIEQIDAAYEGGLDEDEQETLRGFQRLSAEVASRDQ